MLKWFYDFRESMCFQLNKIRYPIPRVLDRVATSALLAENARLSMARFGDGEFGLVLSKHNIGFQNYDGHLAERLREILCSEEDPNVLICIPDLFESVSALKEKPRSYWTSWILCNRAALHPLLNPKRYGDSLVSRLYLPWVDTSREMTIVSNLKKTWANKTVTIVEGAKTRWGVGNDLLEDATYVRRILCPSEHAFSAYEQIYGACMKYMDDTDVFILALGPAATVLAYDLAKAGARALDLGHFDLQYEYLLRKADGRDRIAGKYNNEIGDTDVEDCQDTDYLNSIVERLNGE